MLAWLVAAAGAPQQITRRELSSPPTKCRTSTSWPVSQLARVVELLLQLPQQAPATSFSVLPGAALIACADKAHTVNGDGGAEACAVRTHAACTSTLVALRPPLRVCEPFFKISFLALGSLSTSGSCRGQTTVRRDATELVDHKSCAHRLGSLGYQPGPSKPELDVRLSSTNRHSAFSVVVLLRRRDTHFSR